MLRAEIRALDGREPGDVPGTPGCNATRLGRDASNAVGQQTQGLCSDFRNREQAAALAPRACPVLEAVSRVVSSSARDVEEHK